MKKILLITSMLVCVSNPTLAITREECFDGLPRWARSYLTFRGHRCTSAWSYVKNCLMNISGILVYSDLGGTCEIVPDGAMRLYPFDM